MQKNLAIKGVHAHIILIYFQVTLTTKRKFAECLDIFVQMYITKLKNDNENDNVCTEYARMNFFNFCSKSDFSSLYFIVILQDKFKSATVYCQRYLQ